MKKTMMNKLMTTALASAMALSLAACGAPAETAASAALTGNTDGSVGSILLSVNPEIQMSYDDDGNVVDLTARNDDGRQVLSAFTGYEGRPCTAVVGELVDAINAAGFFTETIEGNGKNIILKLERGSKAPSEAFLDELANAVRVVVDEGQIGSQALALDEDDYDDTYGDQGYINAAAAQELLAAQLGGSGIQFVEKEYDLDDGDYEVEFIRDGVKYEYEVDAVTGKVTEVDVDRNDDLDDIHDDLDDRYDDDLNDNLDDQDDDWNDDRDDNWDDDQDDSWDDDSDDDWDDDLDDSWDDGQDDDWDDGQDDDWDDGQDDDWDDDQDDDWDDDQDDSWDDDSDDSWDDGQDDDWDDDSDDDWDDDSDDDDGDDD